MSANHSSTPTATLPPAPADGTALSAAGAAPPPADRAAVPGYEIVGELGRGGMGVVYRARQVGLNRDVALKMILAGGHASATDLARFRAEAEAVAKLQHPNVVQVYEVGEAGGLPYFSLEFCPGGPLDRRLGGAPQPPREAAALVETLARAVHAAHEAGVVHRDLKPANVLLAADGTPKIADFGLAKRLDGDGGRTASGAILGTPSYMAPEQAAGAKAVGPATDTYALGAILYELLTGRPPFRAATPFDTVMQVIGSEPVPPTRLNPQVPRDLETVALTCLQKDPAKRYASAAALADDLRRWQAGEPIAARPAGRVEKAVKWAKRRPAVVGLAAAVVLAVAAGFAGVLYELRIATAARTRAEAQEGLANQRADALAEEQERVRRELHQSDLLRADLLLQGKEPARAEQLLWRTHLTRPDDDDRRAVWQLWDLYRQRPRRAGRWIGATGTRWLSPDGRWLAVVGDGRVTVYGVATGAVRAEVPKGRTEPYFAAFSRDGGRLGLASTTDGSIAVWDIDPAPKLRATLRPTAAARPDLLMTLGGAMAGLPQDQLRRAQQVLNFLRTRFCFLDGDRVLVADSDGATLWSLDGPAVLARAGFDRPFVSLHRFQGAALPAAPAGDVIPVSHGGAVELWEVPRAAGGTIARTRLDFTETATALHRTPLTGRETGPADRGRSMPEAVLSPDGKYLVTDKDNHLCVWDVASGARLGRADVSGAGSVAVTADGTTVRRCGGDGIRLWRLPGLEPVRTVPLLDVDGWNGTAALSPDGRQTLVVEGGAVAVYDHEPPATVRPFSLPDLGKSVQRTDLAAAGPVVRSTIDAVTVIADGRADRIAVPQGMITPIVQSQLVIAPTGATAIGYNFDGIFGSTVSVFDLAAKRVGGQFKLRDPQQKLVRSPLFQSGAFTISPDGRTLAVATDAGLLLTDLPAGKAVRALRGEPTFGRTGVLFTPDGRAVLGRDAKADDLVLLDVADGRVRARARAAAERALGFSPDGAVLATAVQRRLILRDAATLAGVGEIPASANRLDAGAFAPDGRLFATGSDDGKVRLWDVRRREELTAIDLAAGPISKVVFTPDGWKVRFVAEKQVGELDLHAYDPYVEGNLTWNLLRLLPELSPAEAERVLTRLRDTHPDAYRAGIATTPSPR